MHFGFIVKVLFLFDNLGMYRKFNPNPCGKSVGDCSVRAVSKALGIGWREAYCLNAAQGFNMCDVMSSNAVWGTVLKNHGFNQYPLLDRYPSTYTAEDFLNEHKKGVFVLGFSGHVATAIDGILYDSWDSSSETPVYVWTP